MEIDKYVGNSYILLGEDQDLCFRCFLKLLKAPFSEYWGKDGEPNYFNFTKSKGKYRIEFDHYFKSEDITFKLNTEVKHVALNNNKAKSIFLAEGNKLVQFQTCEDPCLEVEITHEFSPKQVVVTYLVRDISIVHKFRQTGGRDAPYELLSPSDLDTAPKPKTEPKPES